MKILRIIKKSIKDAFKSVFRNFSLSMASISCTAITLILVAIALLVTYNVRNITSEIENVLTIVTFVDSEASEGDIANIEAALENIDNISNIEYNSKEDITKELSKDEDMNAVLGALENSPVQSSFVVSVKDVRKIDNTAKSIKEIDKITRVVYGETLVKKMVSVFDFVKNACIIAVIALIVVTAFLITNTIKITIFSRRNEINIMRLVGTSNTVIKLPFLIEGFVLGVIGSILPILLTIYGYAFLYDYIGGKLLTELIVLVKPADIVYLTSIVLLIVGGVVGMFGSTHAVRRFLKI